MSKGKAFKRVVGGIILILCVMIALLTFSQGVPYVFGDTFLKGNGGTL